MNQKSFPRRAARITRISLRSSVTALLLLFVVVMPALATGSSFTDNLSVYDTGRWDKADWTNGGFFNVGWRPSRINFANDQMHLQLNNNNCPSDCYGKPYASGEYRTDDTYGYGRYEVRMKAAAGYGLVSTFFTYTGSNEGTQHHEIDIEILGSNPYQMHTDYWTNGVSHPKDVYLGFDASAGFHTYAFEWSASSINWYVDNQLVHTENGSRGALPSVNGKIIANLWTATPGTEQEGWLGTFYYPGSPVYADYDWIKYTAPKSPAPPNDTKPWQPWPPIIIGF